MNNDHYKRYLHWKQITLITLTCLLLALAVIQAYFYYKQVIIGKKLKVISQAEIPYEDAELKQFATEFKEIDLQQLYKIIDALVEIMPPHAKIEKLEFDRTTGLQLTCRAQNNDTIIALLQACQKIPLLKNLKLKKSHQEDSSFVFVLQ